MAMQAHQDDYELRLRALRQDQDVQTRAFAQERQELEIRQNGERQWLQEYQRTEVDELAARQQMQVDSHALAEESMLAEHQRIMQQLQEMQRLEEEHLAEQARLEELQREEERLEAHRIAQRQIEAARLQQQREADSHRFSFLYQQMRDRLQAEEASATAAGAAPGAAPGAANDSAAAAEVEVRIGEGIAAHSAAESDDDTLALLQCPVSLDTMTDPVNTSDGLTYDRYIAYALIDSKSNMPNCHDDIFQILGDNLLLRGLLFERVPGSYQLWLDNRSAYIDSIATALEINDLADARLRADRALAFLPRGDPRRQRITDLMQQYDSHNEPHLPDMSPTAPIAQPVNPPEEPHNGEAGGYPVGPADGDTQSDSASLSSNAQEGALPSGQTPIWPHVAPPPTGSIEAARTLPTPPGPPADVQQPVNRQPYLTPVTFQGPTIGAVFPEPASPPDVKVDIIGEACWCTYDLATASWTNSQATQPMHAGRHAATVVMPSGALIVAGGMVGTQKKPTTTVQQLNFDTLTASRLLPTTKTRSHACAVLMGSEGRRTILLAGGLDGDGPARKSCEVYDCNSKKWRLTRKMSIARAQFAAATMQDKRVLVTGGHFGSAGGGRSSIVKEMNALKTCEIYGPNGSWSKAPTMRFARVNHAMALLSDGRLIVMGGSAANPQSTEVFSPRGSNGGTWTTGPDMPPSISCPLRVGTLPNDRLFVVGKEGRSAIYDHRATGEPWQALGSNMPTVSSPILAVIPREC